VDAFAMGLEYVLIHSFGITKKSLYWGRPCAASSSGIAASAVASVSCSAPSSAASACRSCVALLCRCGGSGWWDGRHPASSASSLEREVRVASSALYSSARFLAARRILLPDCVVTVMRTLPTLVMLPLVSWSGRGLIILTLSPTANERGACWASLVAFACVADRVRRTSSALAVSRRASRLVCWRCRSLSCLMISSMSSLVIKYLSKYLSGNNVVFPFPEQNYGPLIRSCDYAKGLLEIDQRGESIKLSTMMGLFPESERRRNTFLSPLPFSIISFLYDIGVGYFGIGI
jgi:hypothetical protein